MGLREVIAEVSEPARVMERVLTEALVLVPCANGAAVQLSADVGHLSCVAATGQLAHTVGLRIPIEGSLTGRCLAEGILEHCPDASVDPRAKTELCAALSIVSVICVPLRRRTGATMGVFVVTSDQPNAFDHGDEGALDRLTDFISTVIGAALDLASVTEQVLAPHIALAGAGVDGAEGEHFERAAAGKRAGMFIANVVRPGAAVQAVTRERIERVLDGHGFEMFVQPIFALDSTQIVEAEALARFGEPSERTPELWFADAAEVGLGEALELYAVDRALALLPQLPDGVRIAVNVGPETFSSASLFERLEASTAHRITVELTEHVGIEVCAKVRCARKTLRDLGAKVAIDDTGTGFASLSLVLELAPEIIKIDRELTRGIDFDPVRRALAEALVGFAAGSGAHVVAEGIETAAELGVLADLGVGYGQGYYLAPPGRVIELGRLFRRPVDTLKPVNRISRSETWSRYAHSR